MIVLLRRYPHVDTDDLDIGKLGQEPYRYRGNEIRRTFGYKWSIPLGPASTLYNDCHHHGNCDTSNGQLAGRIELCSCAHVTRIANAEGRTEIGRQIRKRLSEL